MLLLSRKAHFAATYYIKVYLKGVHTDGCKYE